MDDREAHEFYADPAHREADGPARKHPKDELTEHLSARISPALLAQVANAAASEGRSAGSWVRRALRNELERSGWRADERRRRKAALAGTAETLTGRRHGYTFACQHMSIGAVESAECGICGPLEAAA